MSRATATTWSDGDVDLARAPYVVDVVRLMQLGKDRPGAPLLAGKLLLPAVGARRHLPLRSLLAVSDATEASGAMDGTVESEGGRAATAATAATDPTHPTDATAATAATAAAATQRATGGPAGLDGVTRFMGMRWDDADTVRLVIRPELINRGGLLSGVVTYALVDYGMGAALWAHTTKQEHIATINIAVNYIETATQGEIVCRTSLDRRNRTTAVLRSEVFHEDGRLLVTAVGSYAIFAARRAPPAPAPER